MIKATKQTCILIDRHYSSGIKNIIFLVFIFIIPEANLTVGLPAAVPAAIAAKITASSYRAITVV